MYREERGYTLLELLVVMSIVAALMVMSAYAVRQYWFRRSLDGAQETIVTELRSLQGRTVAETHPVMYGAQLEVGETTFSVLRYNPTLPEPPAGGQVRYRCQKVREVTFDYGVEVTAAAFTDAVTTQGENVSELCATSLRDRAGNLVTSDAADFVFFFPRGDGTSGEMSLTQPALAEGLNTRSVLVTGITGRVEVPEGEGGF